MVDNNPEGSDGTGGDEKVTLGKQEYDTLVQSAAERAQSVANMTDELKELREKNRKLAETNQPQPVDVSAAVETEFKRRDAETAKAAQTSALEKFLDSHTEFSKENDPDGSNFAAFQTAVSRINTSGLKTEGEFAQVLQDALRLMDRKTDIEPQIHSSTPTFTATVPGSQTSVRLNEKEVKLVKQNFGGDVQAFLKVRAKRPAYVEELLNYVR